MALRGEVTNWFLAQVKPNCANIAQKNLSRQGFGTFLPLEDGARRHNGRISTATKPLFPGYIFVAFDAAQGLWRKVNSTQGITRLVSFGKAPAQVPEELVSRLMARCDSAGKLRPPEHFAPGDRVTLTRGPFASFVAEVERVAPDRRVWVLMDLMGGTTRVAVDGRQLRAG